MLDSNTCFCIQSALQGVMRPLTLGENESERQVTSQCHYKNSSELTGCGAPTPTLGTQSSKRRLEALESAAFEAKNH